MAKLASAMLSGADLRTDEVLEKHADWADEIRAKHADLHAENIHGILEEEIGLVFAQVLSDAGVYKCTSEGRSAFLRFTGSIG